MSNGFGGGGGGVDEDASGGGGVVMGGVSSSRAEDNGTPAEGLTPLVCGNPSPDVLQVSTSSSSARNNQYKGKPGKGGYGSEWNV